jgi:hypothetical protein
MFKNAHITLVLLLSTGSVIAQAGELEQAGAKSDVIVLRAETQKLEQDMYTLFNALNSSDDFDVVCDEKAVTGSKIPVWQCDAAFMRDASATDVGRRFDNNPTRQSQFANAPKTSKQISNSYQDKVQKLNDEMKTLAAKNPELGTAMLALHAKRQQLEQAEKLRK